MTDMNGNAQCCQCGIRGERGEDIVLYQADTGAGPQIALWCEDCACVLESEGVRLDRLADQSGEAAA